MHPRLAGKVEQARERGRMDFISTLALPFGGVMEMIFALVIGVAAAHAGSAVMGWLQDRR